MSTVKVTNLSHASAGSPAIVLDAAGDATYAGTHDFSAATVTGVGKILQVVSVTKVDTFTTTSTSYVDITGLTVNITPSATSSKILVMYKVATNLRGTGAIGRLQLLRDAVVIGGGTAVGSRPSAMSSYYDTSADTTNDLSGNFLDSPSSTSALTYKIQGAIHVNTLAINTSASDADSSAQGRTSSTITVMEVGA